MANQNYFKRILAGTLAILTVAGYMPANVGGLLTGGVEIVANAGSIAGIYPNIVSTSLYDDNTHLKELTAEFYWPHTQVSTALVLLDKDIRVQGQEMSNTYSNIATTYEESLKYVQTIFAGTTEFGKTDFEVTNSQTTYQRNIVFPENKLSATDTSKQYYLYLWTKNGSQVYPDMLIAVLQANEDGFFCYQLGDDNNFSYTPTTTGTKIKKSQNLTIDAVDKLYNNQNYDGLTIEGAKAGTQIITYSGRNKTDYATSETAPTAIGDYTVTVAYSGDDEYASASASADFSIVKAQNISAYGYDSNNPDAERNKVSVRVSNDSETFSDVIASVDTADEYYYGQMPEKSEISIPDETFGAVVTVDDDDFYITKKGDRKGTHLDVEELEVNNTYIVNTVIHVEADGNGYDFNIKKEFTYSPRPLSACDVYYLDENGEEQKLDLETALVPEYNSYDVTAFGYDGEEKNLTIIFRNPYNGEKLTLDKEYYFISDDGETNPHNTTSATNSDWYAFGLRAKEDVDGAVNNYADQIFFNWKITPAEMDIHADPNGKVYDGAQAADADFTFTGKHADLLQDADTTMTIEFGRETASETSIKGLQKMNDYLASTVLEEEQIATYARILNQYLKGMVGKYIENDFTLTENANFQFGEITVNGESMAVSDTASTESIERDGKALFLTSASFEDGKLNIAFATEEKIPVTDGISAGKHTAVITVSNPNYLDTTLTVPFEIAKRLVTITPEEKQGITYGDEIIPKIAYIVEDQNDDENTGFIDDDLAENQTRADFFGDIVKINKYISDTDTVTYFSYDGGKNNAGQYDYTLPASTSTFANYELKFADTEFFTVSPKELTQDMFKFTASSVLTYNEKEQDAPEWTYNDGTFADGTAKLTEDDFTVGGPNQAVFPNTYNREFYGQGNYTGEAVINWMIAKDASNSVIVSAEGFTYYGQNAEAHNVVSVL
ncbi:MAG: hypothetical protein IJ644_00270, partial [Oscillospiraceae bacterium]|nr:hypothetical protein [Oscillospiraceae bacterium]